VDFDGRNLDLGDEGRVTVLIGVAGVAGFDGSDMALPKQPEELAEPPARDGHVMGGENNCIRFWGASASCCDSELISRV